MWKQRIISSLWWLLAVGICGLLTAGVQYKKHLPCSDITVNIERVKGHVFINEKEIIRLLKDNGAIVGKPMSAIELQPLEHMLKQQPWIYNAEMFFDNNQVLNVSIEEREPLARIFTISGSSFYIDSSGMHLPLSNDYSARVPMFTSFTSNKKKLSAPDSLLMSDVKKIALLIQQDSFWMAQVSQVNIMPDKTFEIIPVLGNQVIKLGTADSLQSKFDRLTAFYKQVWAKQGFEKYESVSVEFSGQIVAVRRGAPKPTIDIPQAQRLIDAMRNGTDIVKDSVSTAQTVSDPLSLPPDQTDSSAQPISKTLVVNKSINTSNKTKQNTPSLTTKRTAKTIKKTVLNNKKKASG